MTQELANVRTKINTGVHHYLGLGEAVLKAKRTFAGIEFSRAFRYMWHQGLDGRGADHRHVRVQSAVALGA